MPRALALETSSRLGSVALVDDGRVIESTIVPTGLKHAAALLPTIGALLRRHGRAAADLQEVYVAVGPGSFTGLRIGVTLAKTLAWSISARVVAVPSHRVLAENAPPEALALITLLDAKRGQIFTSRFARPAMGGAWQEVEAAHVDTLDAVLKRAATPVWLIGDGIPFHVRDGIADSNVRLIGEAAWRCRAEVVARLGNAAAREGSFADAFTLQPLYIRLAEAEEKRLAASGGPR